jgi:hypothetical protein
VSYRRSLGELMELFDLKWIIPMVMGTIGFIGCIVAFLRDPRGSWALLVITVLSVALIGASVFNKLSLTTSGIVVETAQASLSALDDVEKGLRLNVEAVQKLSERVDKIAELTSALGTQPQAPQSINDKANQIPAKAQEIDTLIKQNKSTLDAIAQSTNKVRELSRVLKGL